MSRARPIAGLWFDQNRNGEIASDEQLELLASVLDVEVDELLDAGYTQGQVMERLKMELGIGPIPEDVLERRARARAQRQVQPVCRKCGKEGDSTRHHYVNRWILKELSSYASKWADRSKNCIPLCIECHRHLHYRDDSDKSIVGLLSEEEKQFLNEALNGLANERPRLLISIGKGDPGVYEAQLVKDWFNGAFDVPIVEEPYLRVVG